MGRHLAPCWSFPGAVGLFWGPVDAVVGASLGPLGAPLGAIWAPLSELFLSPLRPSSGAFSGHFLRPCRVFALGPVRSSSAFLGSLPGALLRPLWGHLRTLLERLLGPSYAQSWGFSGPSSSLSWAPLRPLSGRYWDPLGMPFEVLPGPLGAPLGSSWSALSGIVSARFTFLIFIHTMFEPVVDKS